MHLSKLLRRPIWPTCPIITVLSLMVKQCGSEIKRHDIADCHKSKAYSWLWSCRCSEAFTHKFRQSHSLKTQVVLQNCHAYYLWSNICKCCANSRTKEGSSSGYRRQIRQIWRKICPRDLNRRLDWARERISRCFERQGFSGMLQIVKYRLHHMESHIVVRTGNATWVSSWVFKIHEDSMISLYQTLWFCIFDQHRDTTPQGYLLQLQDEFAAALKDYVGRESPLYHAERLSEHYRQ